MIQNARTYCCVIAVAVLSNSICEAAPYLLKTKWGQRKEFAKYAQGNDRVGCWSTAIGQILYFHKLQPSGAVSYTCTDSRQISYEVPPGKIDFRALAKSKDKIAKYLYQTSVIIQKDFGTGSYCLSHKKRAAAVATYYGCNVEMFDYSKMEREEFLSILEAEIKAKRPVMFHLRDKAKNNFHAVAVDGYRMKKNKPYVHINMGFAGKRDGWYEFGTPVSKYDDVEYVKMFTVAKKMP